MTFNVTMDSPRPGVRVESVAPDGLYLTGQIQPRQNPARSWTGSWDQPGMRFAAIMKVRTEGGSVRSESGRIGVTGASSATILFNATSFRNYRDIAGDAAGRARGFLARAALRPYAALRLRHANDFGRLFSRVRLTLGDTRSAETTDSRIRSFAGTEDPDRVALWKGGQRSNMLGSVLVVRRNFKFA